MSKSLFIAEKPSVAREFAKALKVSGAGRDGYIESESAIVTWCVGHLVTMSYPEAYDPSLKRWSMDTLPFLPKEFKYQLIEDTKKQFQIVSGLLNRKDVETIYVCTDSGREGEYIYRLVEQMAGVKGKARRRVWIDSQTEEEILRGVREAKDLSEYDNLAASAYLRAKEDYLMGINFSRALTLKYGPPVASYLGERRAVAVRELTKLHEERVEFRLSAGYPKEPRGEFVLLVEGAGSENALNALSPEAHIAHYLSLGLDKKEALKAAAKDRGVSKREIYQALL